jgi:3-hydroxyacyl-[acyl-carrier-protein] dehydratase
MLNFEQIREILAHGFPFLMIDRVIELEVGKRIVAVKNVTGNEIHFLGHFPRLAVMPGVLIIEAMAQAMSVLYLKSRADPGGPPIIGYLTNAAVRFMKPVVPGDQMRIEMEILKQIDYGIISRGVVRVDDTIVAKGELTLGKKEQEP